MFSILKFIHRFFRKEPRLDPGPEYRSASVDELTIPEDDVSFLWFLENEKPESTTPANPEHEVPASYFAPYVSDLCSSASSVPLRLDLESLSSLEFRTYNHPTWSDWPTLWATDPYEFDPKCLPSPSYETDFHGALFRLTLDFTNRVPRHLPIYQGTSFVFKGYDNPFVRYIVEWRQLTIDNYAYLKVVGMRECGNPYPYNDPIHPSFILVVPRKSAFVPYPPPIAQSLTCRHYAPRFPHQP
jgi:hypothetical protein